MGLSGSNRMVNVLCINGGSGLGVQRRESRYKEEECETFHSIGGEVKEGGGGGMVVC